MQEDAVGPLPPEIIEFVSDNITCIEQLEILRVLEENPGREWDAYELSRAVQATPEVVACHIAVMQGRGLLTTRGEKNPTCRFGPVPELGEIVGQLLQFYNERPVTLIKFVYHKAAIHLQTFSDAFRIKEEKKQ